MKLRFSHQKNRAWTIWEMLMVIAVLVFLAAMLLPVLAATRLHSGSINCVSNLNQIQGAFRIWEEDKNKIHLLSAETGASAMKLIATNNVAGFFLMMSNELCTPKLLVCPEDPNVIYPTRQFGSEFAPDFRNQNISYFVGVDIDSTHPLGLRFGDDNFVIGGMAVTSGVLRLSSNTSVAWGSGRHDYGSRIPVLGIPLEHRFMGNICFADGSVVEVSTLGLQKALVQTGIATNRLAIP